MIVIKAFVTRAVRHDQFGPRFFQSAHQFDGVFNALARNQPRGLKDEDVVGRKADLLAQVAGILVHRGWFGVEIEDIRDERRGDPFALGQFAAGGGVDDDVLDALTGWAEIRASRISCTALIMNRCRSQ